MTEALNDRQVVRVSGHDLNGMSEIIMRNYDSRLEVVSFRSSADAKQTVVSQGRT